MSDDYEESPYEDDEPKQALNGEILPPLLPLKKQRSWQDVAIWAIVGLVAWHVVDRVGKATAPVAMQRADMVTENLPVSQDVEDRRVAEPPSRYAYSSTSGRGIRERASAYPPTAYREPDEEDSDLTYERRLPPRHHTTNVWPGHDGAEIDEDEERERDLEDARRVGREAARREADRPSRGFWPFFEAIDPGSQARHERYMAYTREMQRQRGY